MARLVWRRVRRRRRWVMRATRKVKGRRRLEAFVTLADYSPARYWIECIPSDRPYNYVLGDPAASIMAARRKAEAVCAAWATVTDRRDRRDRDRRRQAEATPPSNRLRWRPPDFARPSLLDDVPP